MKQRNKSVITFQDFVFYVIYSKYGGYGFHDKATLRKNIVTDLKGVPTVKGHRFHQCDWTPISGMMSEGMAELKYDGVTTADGVAQLADNGGLCLAVDTMGSLTVGFGHLPAVSLEDDFSTPYYYVRTSKDDMMRIFRDKYFDAINECQAYQHTQAYVSPLVMNERIDEACRAAYRHPYDELTGSTKKVADKKLEKISELLDRLMDWLHDLPNTNVPELDKSSFVVDFRQLEFDFPNE